MAAEPEGEAASSGWLPPPGAPRPAAGAERADYADHGAQRLLQTFERLSHSEPVRAGVGVEEASAEPEAAPPGSGAREVDEEVAANDGAESPAGREAVARPLAPPGSGEQARERSGLIRGTASGGPGSTVLTIGSSLAIVLGLFLVFAWLLRRSTPGLAATLPAEVVEVLGRAPLTGRQQVHLLRLGHKLVLVSVDAGGAETLAEVTDPEEVDRLAGLCRQAQPNSASAAFRQVFQQFSREPAGAVGTGLPGPQAFSTRHLGRQAREVADAG